MPQEPPAFTAARAALLKLVSESPGIHAGVATIHVADQISGGRLPDGRTIEAAQAIITAEVESGTLTRSEYRLFLP